MFNIDLEIPKMENCVTMKDAKEKFRESCTLCLNTPSQLLYSCENCKLARKHKCIIEELSRYTLV